MLVDRHPGRASRVPPALLASALGATTALALLVGPPQSAAAPGGTLRVATDDAPDSLDPAFAYSPRSWQILTNTGAGLLAFRRQGGRGGASLVPDLAAALPSVSGGGRRYVFRLRPGLRFSGGGGRRIRPSDVKASIERLFAGASRGRVLYRGIAGARSFERTRRGGIAGIVARDASGTVEIRLSRPDPTFLRALALPFAHVVPSETDRRESPSPLDGAGPYSVASYERGERLVLERSRVYRRRGELDPGQVNRIDVRFGVRASSAFDAIRRGNLDYAQDAPGAAARRGVAGRDSG
ncbi:MAG: ABC transporter substrate-binding protein, partial [Miltoncostaeaceae bacterium]